MRAAIPEFPTTIRLLSKLLESAYAQTCKRTRLAVCRVVLQNVGWQMQHDKAFQECKLALENQVTLAPVDQSKRLRV